MGSQDPEISACAPIGGGKTCNVISNGRAGKQEYATRAGPDQGKIPGIRRLSRIKQAFRAADVYRQLDVRLPGCRSQRDGWATAMLTTVRELADLAE